MTWEEVVWAAVTVGRPSVAYLLAHGWHSLSDIVVRSHTVYANLRQSGPFIEKSSLYTDSDPSEKSGISYFMGMVAAKLVASRLLDTPWLLHVSMIKALGTSISLWGKSQPDLVGVRRNGDWIVVEAKGRTRGYDAAALKSAKMQTRHLRKISGRFPALRVAVQASFNPKLTWAIDDPEEFDDGAPDLELDLREALEMYYSAASSAVSSGSRDTIGQRSLLIHQVPEVGVAIGLDTEFRDRLLERAMPEDTLPLTSAVNSILKCNT